MGEVSNKVKQCINHTATMMSWCGYEILKL